MKTLTSGARAWMSNHIASGLHKLGIDVTPEALEGEVARMNAALHTCGDFTPPDPYREALERLKRDVPSAHRPEPTPRPNNTNAPPDPYAAGLERLRKESR